MWKILSNGFHNRKFLENELIGQWCKGKRKSSREKDPIDRTSPMNCWTTVGVYTKILSHSDSRSFFCWVVCVCFWWLFFGFCFLPAQHSQAEGFSNSIAQNLMKWRFQWLNQEAYKWKALPCPRLTKIMFAMSAVSFKHPTFQLTTKAHWTMESQRSSRMGTDVFA